MVVDGWVQGVGFCYFVQMEVDRYKIVGWVKNCDDGWVEIFVEGFEELLKKFVEVVRKGSFFLNVIGVIVEELCYLKGYCIFFISY